MSKALSNLIQVGPALGRGEGFSQLTFSGPFQPGLFCGSVEVGLGVGGGGLACFGWRGQELGGRRKGTLKKWLCWRNCINSGDLKYLRL